MDSDAAEEAVTSDSALANAVRLLRVAEMETNLPLMERIEHLADSWIAIAALMASKEQSYD